MQLVRGLNRLSTSWYLKVCTDNQLPFTHYLLTGTYTERSCIFSLKAETWLCLLTSLGADPCSASGTPRQQPVELQGAKFKQQKSHESNFSNIQLLGTILKITFLLIQPQCLISKRLYSKRSTNDYVRSPPSHRKTQQFFQPKRGVTKSRNIDQMNH